ncbi:MAG: phosphoribosylformylglycinamidine cyclo-ligase [Chloroflexota bacterium]
MEINPVKDAYAGAGVDIDAAARAKEFIKRYARTTYGPEVLSGIGFFGGLYEFKGYREPVLVSHVDGVGTKLLVASVLDKHDTVGIDIVNHCVNDILTCGASPLLFLDYIGMGKLVPEKVASIARGLTDACREAGCALIGGETAEMPGLYHGEDYDLAGFIVGVVEKSGIIMGKDILAGDAVLGLSSSGLHTNGYSLVRKVFGTDKAILNAFSPELGKTLGEELLRPHRCYYHQLKPVLPLLKGIAHITGGGLVGNVPRVLPEGMAAVFHSTSWVVPPIFRMIEKQGNVTRDEMYQVFNMGIGMVLITAPDKVPRIQSALPEAVILGEVVKQVDETRVIIDGRGFKRNKVN